MQKMKRPSFALCCLFAFSLVSCGGGPGEEPSKDSSSCQHQFALKSETPSTCESSGSQIYECSLCGYDKTVALDPLGHAFGDWAQEKQASCTESEVLERHCTRAGCSKKEEKAGQEALGHLWGEWAREGDSMKRHCQREGCNAEQEKAAPFIKIISSGEEVSPFLPAVEEYLNAETPDVKDYVRNDGGIQGYLVRFIDTYSEVKEVRIDYSKREDFSTYQSVFAESAKKSCALYNLEKASTYYVRACVQEEGREVYSAIETLQTASYGPRVMKIDGIHNVRDIGGYETPSGRTLQGLLFRGGALSPSTDPAFTKIQLSEEGKEYMSGTLGIKTDFDLRTQAENRAPDTPLDSGLTSSPIPGAKLEYYGVGGYESGLANKEGYRRVFSALSDPSRYPIYLHCTGGADPPGTVSYLLNGLLGVSEEDLIHDYEFTSFSIYGERNSKGGEYHFPQLVSEITSYPGSTLSEKTESYLLSCGVGEEEIYNIKAIFHGQKTKLSLSCPSHFDTIAESTLTLQVKGGFENVTSLTLNGIGTPFEVKGDSLLVRKEDFPASLQDGEVQGAVVIDGVSYSFSFQLSGSSSLIAFDFSSGDIVLNESKSKISGNVIGYQGKTALFRIKESATHGGTYLFIGSYGVYLRGDGFRLAQRSGDSFSESAPRVYVEGANLPQSKVNGGVLLGIAANALNEKTIRLEIYANKVKLGYHDFARVEDEIPSEEARFELAISGDVTQASLSSPQSAD